MPLELTPLQPPYYEITSGPAPSGTKYYIAQLTQSGTAAPTADILQNTLGGTLVWTRTAAGRYIGTLIGAFPVDVKTTMFISGLNQGFGYYTWISEDEVEIETRNAAGALADDFLFTTAIQIIVIP